MPDNCIITGKPCSDPKVNHVTEITDSGYRIFRLCQKCFFKYFNSEHTVEEKENLDKVRSMLDKAFKKVIIDNPLPQKTEERLQEIQMFYTAFKCKFEEVLNIGDAQKIKEFENKIKKIEKFLILQRKMRDEISQSKNPEIISALVEKMNKIVEKMFSDLNLKRW